MSLGPIQHHESKTVECWCRHCVWWKAKAQQQERKRLLKEVQMMPIGYVGPTKVDVIPRNVIVDLLTDDDSFPCREEDFDPR